MLLTLSTWVGVRCFTLWWLLLSSLQFFLLTTDDAKLAQGRLPAEEEVEVHHESWSWLVSFPQYLIDEHLHNSVPHPSPSVSHILGCSAVGCAWATTPAPARWQVAQEVEVLYAGIALAFLCLWVPWSGGAVATVPWWWGHCAVLPAMMI